LDYEERLGNKWCAADVGKDFMVECRRNIKTFHRVPVGAKVKKYPQRGTASKEDEIMEAAIIKKPPLPKKLSKNFFVHHFL
jgi:hypothetical protein